VLTPLLLVHATYIQLLFSPLLRSEIPNGIYAKLRTVAASNNRVHMPWSLYYCLFTPHICMALFFTHIPSTQHHWRGCNTAHWRRADGRPSGINITQDSWPQVRIGTRPIPKMKALRCLKAPSLWPRNNKVQGIRVSRTNWCINLLLPSVTRAIMPSRVLKLLDPLQCIQLIFQLTLTWVFGKTYYLVF